ncbi:zinc ribbon domain-containing protein [Methanoregula sp.]|uniref:zinc ribbon domain-containing protein n=1 Tax=Methanoregula sp. TaxID=2052170 RepID=UPI0035665CAC
MQAIQYCSNCGRENEINSEFCKYCGGSIRRKNTQRPEKKYSSLFEYLKENSGYIVIAGVFAALSVYLTQFNNANKSLLWIFNGSMSSPNFHFLNNSSNLTSQNLINHINFSANVSVYSVSSQNFFGVNETFLNIPQDQVLSSAIAASFSIFFLISAKIWYDIQTMDISSDGNFVSSFSKKSTKWLFLIFYGYLIIFLGLYVIHEYLLAVFAYVFLLVPLGSVYLTISIYLHLKKKSGKFFVLDSIIYGLFLIEYFLISTILLLSGIFTSTFESGIVGWVVLLSLPGCLMGIFLGFWPSIKILLSWILIWVTNKVRFLDRI